MIFDDRACELGEGAFWHPGRQQLFWCDILNRQLLSQGPDGPTVWNFPEMISAMAWVDNDVLLIASAVDVFLFDLETGETRAIAPLEASKPANRSNDGRADRQGGFWIGTMAREDADRKGKGAIYRLYQGQGRCLFPGLSIPNAICFSPDGGTAYFADTMAQTVWKVALDADGWPAGPQEVFLDFTGTDIFPDGATIDAEGNFWNAQWGSSRVACYSPAGQFLREVSFGAPHTSCPAFGGPDMTTLYCTTAREGMSPEALAAHPDAGRVFAVHDVAKGLPEPRFRA
ncbi:SMP-30/gluconolactonase/LRE family protein [bacterium]|nr:SMP-30/gluconolactonase/LRE family protein [bacterium]